MDKLLRLAASFEEKRFLPRAADIRNLAEAFGGADIRVKNRQAAVPAVFKFLCSLSDEQIDRILAENLFCGPSELGPIADAIKERGDRRRDG
jgi:hypothetical protein